MKEPTNQNKIHKPSTASQNVVLRTWIALGGSSEIFITF